MVGLVHNQKAGIPTLVKERFSAVKRMNSGASQVRTLRSYSYLSFLLLYEAIIWYMNQSMLFTIILDVTSSRADSLKVLCPYKRNKFDYRCLIMTTCNQHIIVFILSNNIPVQICI